MSIRAMADRSVTAPVGARHLELVTATFQDPPWPAVSAGHGSVLEDNLAETMTDEVHNWLVDMLAESTRVQPAHAGDGYPSLRAVYLGNSTYEIYVSGVIAGFIHRAGRVFVALFGDRLDQAVECGQFLLWDTAAAELAHRARGRRMA